MASNLSRRRAVDHEQSTVAAGYGYSRYQYRPSGTPSVRRKPSTSLAGNDTRVHSAVSGAWPERRFAARASRWQVYRTLGRPASMPALFSSLRITSTFSLMGSIVGKYVAGGGRGLGYELITAKRSIDAALVMAITLVATVTGVMVFPAVTGVERLVLSCRGQTNL
jgi:hypothetical protein